MTRLGVLSLLMSAPLNGLAGGPKPPLPIEGSARFFDFGTHGVSLLFLAKKSFTYVYEFKNDIRKPSQRLEKGDAWIL